MLLVLATSFGLVVWIALWAIGTKSFDAFMITTVVVVLAATVRILQNYFLPSADDTEF
jgi:hypothetical protein